MNQNKDQWQEMVSKYQLPDHSPQLMMQTINYLESRQKRHRRLNILLGLGSFILMVTGYYLLLELTPLSRWITQIWLQLTQFYFVSFYPNFFWGFVNFTIISTLGLLAVLAVMILIEVGLQTFGD